MAFAIFKFSEMKQYCNNYPVFYTEVFSGIFWPNSKAVIQAIQQNSQHKLKYLHKKILVKHFKLQEGTGSKNQPLQGDLFAYMKFNGRGILRHFDRCGICPPGFKFFFFNWYPLVQETIYTSNSKLVYNPAIV